MSCCNSDITVDLAAYVGENIQLRVPVTDSSGAVKSLAGATVILRLGDIRGARTFVEKDCTIEGDGSTGIIVVELTPTDLEAVTGWDNLDYMFIAEDAAGRTEVVKRGIMNITAMLNAL